MKWEWVYMYKWVCDHVYIKHYIPFCLLGKSVATNRIAFVCPVKMIFHAVFKP